MIELPQNANEPRKRTMGARGRIPGVIALVALLVAVGAWFWLSYQPPQPKGMDAGLGLPHGLIVVGAGTFLTALIAEIRVMSAWEMLEAAWELLLGLLSLIGVILKGIWNGILSLFGWD